MLVPPIARVSLGCDVLPSLAPPLTTFNYVKLHTVVLSVGKLANKHTHTQWHRMG